MYIYKPNKSERLKILDKNEVKNTYDCSYFTYEESCQYFTLSQTEKALFQVLCSVRSKVYYVLQFGYFKFKQLFFTFDFQDMSEDFQYILKEHFNNIQVDDLSLINRFTRTKYLGRMW